MSRARPVDELRWRWRPSPVALASMTIASWLGFTASVFLRPTRGEYNAWLDAGLYQTPFLLAAGCCWARASRRERDWTAWLTMGIGLIMYVGGNLYGSIVVGDRDIYPSPADAMWLSFYVIAYLAIVQLVRAQVSGFQPSTWLDGIVAGLSCAALAVAFALGPALMETNGTVAVVATTLAYPTADILLIIVLVASGIALRGRTHSFWALGAGVGVFCATDIRYLFEESSGTYAEGGLLDVGWPLAAVIIGVAACWSRTSDGLAEAKPSILIPVAAAVISIGLLCYGQRGDLPIVAVVLATTALVVGTVRVALTIREVTALAASRREARTDELTGLANRRQLVELLTRDIESGREHAALLIADLDGFKEVNDSLGHIAGDELLSIVARRLSLATPAPAIVARLGGDEFAVLLIGSFAQAHDLAEKLRAEVRRPFVVQGVQLMVDVSIGFACSPEHGSTAVDILSRADIAMFRAKRQRTGVEAYDPKTDTPSRDRLELLADLRAAFIQEQFVVYYQPQMDVGTGSIVGVEALVRWHHPSRGLVPPDEFLPMIEQCNLMSSLTEFVLRSALRDCATLRRCGLDLRVAVNISASDLVGAELPDLIHRVLTHHDLAPDKLVIEVTEESVMVDRVRCLQTLRQIRDSGVRISVDDYGTGQASLSYIRDLPITELKLDRSFLRNVPADTHNAAIIRSTIELAHALELPIVAEGIEDATTLAWLRDLGCDVGQGFHIARPLPLDDLIAYFGIAPTPFEAEFVES